MIRAAAVVCFVSLLSVGCTPKPVGKGLSQLERYMEQYNFAAFAPPRTADGLGTIISFNERGEESVIASRERCLPSAQIPSLPEDGSDSRIALLEGSYKIDQSNRSEIEITKALTQQALGIPIDLSAALELQDVTEVEIGFTEPFRNRIERIVVKDYLRSLEEVQSCVEEIQRDDTLIIHTVLGAKGMSFRFIGSGGRAMPIGINIVEAIKLGNEYKNEWEGKFVIEVGQQILLGYRAWKASTVSGVAFADFDLLEIDRDEVEALRAMAQ